jgi:hypothetical protein
MGGQWRNKLYRYGNQGRTFLKTEINIRIAQQNFSTAKQLRYQLFNEDPVPRCWSRITGNKEVYSEHCNEHDTHVLVLFSISLSAVSVG